MDYHPFEGRLIRLRIREPEDAPLLFQWFNDPEVTEHLAIRYPVSHRQERDFVDSVSRSGYDAAHFAITDKASGRLIGGVDLLETRAENRVATLGIAIGDRTAWGGGYGTDTMRTVCRFGFEMMNLHRITLEVLAPNRRATRVYEKVGFRHEAVRREAAYRYGRYVDVLVMGLLRGELLLD